jgi:hypothetical protein
MEQVFKLIQENPKEFIQTLKEKFCKNGSYLSNSHWADFDGTKDLSFHEKSDDGSIESDQIWFTFEDDLEGSTNMIMGMDINKAKGNNQEEGVLKFKGYAFPYRLEYDWND